MMTLLNPIFWFSFFYYLLAIFLAFYIPGRLVLDKTKGISKMATLVISFILGMVLWGWQGIIFGYLNIRFLSYFYLLCLFLIWLKKKHKYLREFVIKRNEIDFLAFFIIICGVSIQILQFALSGMHFSDGLRFYNRVTEDALWHIALTNQIIKRVPPFQPGAYGILVQNYHHWSNLVTGELIRVFNLPLIQTQIQFMLLFSSLFLGLCAYVFAVSLVHSKTFARWLLFFLYLGGDASYWVIFILRRVWDFGAPVLEDGTMFYENPPRAFAVVVVLTGLSMFVLWIKQKDLYLGALMAILFGTVIGFKVYQGIVVLAGLVFVSLFYLYKRELKMLIPPIISVLLALVVFLPTNASSGGLFFAPFQWVRMFVTQENVGLVTLELRRQTFEAYGDFTRVWQQDLIIFLIFLISQYGTKLIGLFQVKETLKQLGWEKNLFFFGSLFVAIFLGTFFLQVAGNTNVFNFYLAASLFLSITTSFALAYYQNKLTKSLSILLAMLIIVVTIPRVIQKTMLSTESLIKGKYFLISQDILEGSRFLKLNTSSNATFLVVNKNTIDAETPMMSFLFDRRMFLSGQGILNSHRVDIETRKKAVNRILNSNNLKEVFTELKKNKIDYLCFLKDKKLTVNVRDLPIPAEKVFENPAMTVFKINFE